MLLTVVITHTMQLTYNHASSGLFVFPTQCSLPITRTKQLTYDHAFSSGFYPHNAQDHTREARNGHDRSSHEHPVEVNTGTNDQQSTGHYGNRYPQDGPALQP